MVRVGMHNDEHVFEPTNTYLQSYEEGLRYHRFMNQNDVLAEFKTPLQEESPKWFAGGSRCFGSGRFGSQGFWFGAFWFAVNLVREPNLIRHK